VFSEWFRTRRFAGSKDRRAVRDLVYNAIRACGPIPESGRAAMLRLVQGDEALASLFDGGRHAPEPIDPAEPVAQGGVAPAWLERALESSGVSGDEALALLDRAPLDVRVNALKAERDGLVLPVEGEPLPARYGLRFPPTRRSKAGRPTSKAGRGAGWRLATDLRGGGCAAGRNRDRSVRRGGGKTLALAASMAGKGRLVACDVDRARLQRLAPRAERAGAPLIETLLMNPNRELEALAGLAGKADAVLIDAPCSGTGTWRRNPEARWRLSERNWRG
jgi:16S rRNA (cytosine967-C5)-methyltransferase